ncbi:MAG TPA: hypothetical protein VHZ74_20115, partial [Bryobacteraceae bacterium]|nr:hypothetical protein [Bryobacteraceae bacterium]
KAAASAWDLSVSQEIGQWPRRDGWPCASFIAGVLLAQQVEDGGLPAPPHIHPRAFDVQF